MISMLMQIIDNMATYCMEYIFVISIIAVNRIGCQIDQPPSPATARIGDTVKLMCVISNPDEGTEWWEYNSSPVGTRIFKSSVGVIGDPNKYEIEGTYNLIIKNLEFADGGVYGCITDSMWAPAGADLVVIEEPQAISGELIEGETTLVSCKTRYQSSSHNEMDPLHIPKTEGYIFEDKIVTDYETIKSPDYYTVKIDMNYTGMRSDNGRHLTCRTYTEEPFYEDYGRLPMDVKYEVGDIDLNPKNLYYYVGEYINCTASGNPYPDFQWIAIYSPGARPVTGQTLDITMNMIGENEWKCQATNTVREIVDVEMSIQFEVREDDTGRGGEEVISPTAEDI